ISAQGTFLPLGSDAYMLIDRMDIQYSKVQPTIHTNFKPYSRKWVAEYAQEINAQNISGDARFEYNLAWLYRENTEWLKDTIVKSEKPILKYFYTEPAAFASVDKGPFKLRINPVLHFEVGKEFGADKLRFFNSRGGEMRMYIKKKVSAYFFLAENQMRRMSFVQDKIRSDQAIPGEGYWKEYRGDAQDFFTARGYITFNLLDHIDVQFGHDKNFIGNGMRSLILSDFGANQFFMKLQTSIWKIRYTNLYTEMTATYNRGGDRLLDKKYMTLHHLNASISHWLEIGVFESVIFSRDNGYDFQYLNPIIFYRSVELGLGSPDNVLLGLDYKANIARRFQLYGQFVLDEFNLSNVLAGNGWWANKFAIQTGLKYINAFGLDQLDLQMEYNWVRPYMYSQGSPEITYTHYNQALAHPLGANFWELTGNIRYQIIPELTANLRWMYAKQGTDTLGSNFGSNIFIPTNDADGRLVTNSEFGNEMLQGVLHKTILLDFMLSYQIRHNIYFDLSIVYRNLKSEITAQSNNQFFVGTGFRMNIPYRRYMY
ncbi:MAG: hypothetical protein WD334_12100, partial [Chitinophagales bacterium]